MEEYGLTRLDEDTVLVKIIDYSCKNLKLTKAKIISKGSIGIPWEGVVLYLPKHEIAYLEEGIALIHKYSIKAQCK